MGVIIMAAKVRLSTKGYILAIWVETLELATGSYESNDWIRLFIVWEAGTATASLWGWKKR
jgi:hypothetical protein